MVFEAGVGEQFFSTHEGTQPPEQTIGVGGNHDPLLVFARIEIRRGKPGQEGSGPGPLVAGFFVFGQGRFQHGKHGFIQSRIDHLAGSAVDIPIVERHQGAQRGKHAGQGVANADTHPTRRAVRETDQVAQPAKGFGHRGKAGFFPIRAGLAVAGDAGKDETRIQLTQDLIAKAPLFKHSGAKIFHEDIGLTDQPAKQILSFRVAQVERNTFLIARNARPPQAFAVHQRLADRAHGVALAGGFDLNDLCSKISQESGAKRTGQQSAAFNHPYTGQRTAGFAPLCSHIVPFSTYCFAGTISPLAVRVKLVPTMSNLHHTVKNGQYAQKYGFQSYWCSGRSRAAPF